MKYIQLLLFLIIPYILSAQLDGYVLNDTSKTSGLVSTKIYIGKGKGSKKINLCEHTNLKELNYVTHSLKKIKLPTCLPSIDSLQTIYFWTVRITNPDILFNLKQLTTLYCADNSFNKQIIEIPSLEYLSFKIKHKVIIKDTIKFVKNKNYRYFKVYNGHEVIVDTSIRELKNLEELSLNFNIFDTNLGFKKAYFPHLNTIYIGYIDFTKKMISEASINNLIGFKDISFSKCKFTDAQKEIINKILGKNVKIYD